MLINRLKLFQVVGRDIGNFIIEFVGSLEAGKASRYINISVYFRQFHTRKFFHRENSIPASYDNKYHQYIFENNPEGMRE